ncbi:MAG: Uma2 family endonuclease [Clostridium sp.]
MAINVINERIYTYDDYLQFPSNEVVEIIDGRIFAMSPAPSRIHQKLIMELSYQINAYIKSNNGSCEVYPAPFDVVLVSENESANTSRNVVQPDISVICDKNKLTDKGCTGAPNMIIEVVSVFNPQNDYVKKLALYQKYGVQEYWIVNPMKKNILVYFLTDTGYNMPDLYTFENTINVNIFKNLKIDFNLIDN